MLLSRTRSGEGDADPYGWSVRVDHHGHRLRLIRTYPRLALRLVAALAACVEQAATRLVVFAFRTVTAVRMRRAGDESQVMEGVSHQELADRVDARHETATRDLVHLI